MEGRGRGEEWERREEEWRMERSGEI